MKKGLTEIVFILDRSGSMSGLERDTIGGFNAMIEKQKREKGKALVSTVLFDTECTVIHDRVSIDKVPPMTEKEYYPRGCTALLDAVGGAIKHIANIHKYARKEDVPERTLFVIMTDGMENASGEFSHRDIRRMIDERTKEYGWEFLFVAANIDAVEAADTIGIRASRAANYRQDSAGVGACYSAMSEFVSYCRASQTNAQDDDESWKAELEDNK